MPQVSSLNCSDMDKRFGTIHFWRPIWRGAGRGLEIYAAFVDFIVFKQYIYCSLSQMVRVGGDHKIGHFLRMS